MQLRTAHRLRVLGTIFTAALWLNGCGGGSSSNNSSAPSNLTVTNTVIPKINEDRLRGAAEIPISAYVDADVLGIQDLPSGTTLYVFVSDPNRIFVDSHLEDLSTNRYRLHFNASASPMDLPVGIFNSALTLSLCLDSACSKQAVGSPISVPYSISIGKGLDVEGMSTGSSFIALDGSPGATTIRDLAISLPSSTLSWSVTSNSDTPFVTFSKIDDPSPAVRVTAQAASAGTYINGVNVTAKALTPAGRIVDLYTGNNVYYTVK